MGDQQFVLKNVELGCDWLHVVNHGVKPDIFATHLELSMVSYFLPLKFWDNQSSIFPFRLGNVLSFR